MVNRSEAYAAAAAMADKASALIEAAGFSVDGSNLGDARYFTRPGSAAKIRVATYAHGHADQVSLTFDRDRCLQGWYLTDAEIASEVLRAVADYEALVAELAADDEE